MGTRHPDVDAYVARAADFARPILTRLRARVHATCPDVEESIKWGHPSFGRKGMLCGMAAFKGHCAFGFAKHALVVGPEDAKAREAMGSFGCLRSVRDLPPKAALARYIRTAIDLNERGVRVARTKTVTRGPPRTPSALADGLARNAKARATFRGLSPSHRREYVEWISEAKRDETRARRVATTLAWLVEGKSRNWKYERR